MMELDEKIGTRKKIELSFEIINKGNWNLKYPNEQPVYTKPMGIVYNNNGFNYIYTHNDIINLIKFYCEVDKKAIQMIDDININTGIVKQKERTLKTKILKELDKINYEV